MRLVSLPGSRAGVALLAFWALLLLSGLILAGTLQWLGPPHRSTGVVQPRKVIAKAVASKVPVVAKPVPAVVQRHDIAGPDNALLEPASSNDLGHDPGAMLPRISQDGREARLVYAAPAPVLPSGTKRIAILLDGVGLSAADSLDAIGQLPSAVSLAVSPYAIEPGVVLDAARAAGHEMLLSLPMEPANAPVDDEGGKAMTEQVDPDENMQRLDWSLSRIQGYAGITNAASGLDGERFAASPQFTIVARMLARRGLFYLDATPDTVVPDALPGVVADLRLDDPPDAAAIGRQLARLEQIAVTKGSAIGIAGPLYPVTIRRLADWARTLPTRGLVLVPVSSLVHARTTSRSAP